MRQYLRELADTQAEILLALTYLFVVTPVWLALRVSGRRLLGPNGPSWIARTERRPDVAEMEVPF